MPEKQMSTTLLSPNVQQLKAVYGQIDLAAVAASTCACGCSCHIEHEDE